MPVFFYIFPFVMTVLSASPFLKNKALRDFAKKQIRLKLRLSIDFFLKKTRKMKSNHIQPRNHELFARQPTNHQLAISSDIENDVEVISVENVAL